MSHVWFDGLFYALLSELSHTLIFSPKCNPPSDHGEAPSSTKHSRSISVTSQKITRFKVVGRECVSNRDQKPFLRVNQGGRRRWDGKYWQLLAVQSAMPGKRPMTKGIIVDSRFSTVSRNRPRISLAWRSCHGREKRSTNSPYNLLGSGPLMSPKNVLLIWSHIYRCQR